MFKGLTLSKPILVLPVQDDELTIIDVRKFKAIHKRKFTYEVCFILIRSIMLTSSS